MIRLAQLADINSIVSLCRQLHLASPYSDAEFDELKVKDLFRHIIKDPLECIGLVVEHKGKVTGILGAVTSKLPFSEGKLAMEIAWWTDKPNSMLFDGIKLLEAYEYWARNIAKAQYISVGNMNVSPKLAKLYAKKGYEKKEETWLSRL